VSPSRNTCGVMVVMPMMARDEHEK